jgi:pimeloyl-ACP methyl ester carboxylesterase
MPSSRTISANGIDIFLLERGEGPLLLLWHGWPELSYSWRYQIPAIAAAGFHVVAPDMRGLGEPAHPPTSRPTASSVAALGEMRVADISHDWRAPVASRGVLLFM